MTKTALLATAIIPLGGAAMADNPTPKAMFEDLWNRCASHVMRGERLNTDGLKEMNAKRARKITGSDVPVYMLPKRKGVRYSLDKFYLHRAEGGGCLLAAPPVKAGDAQSIIWSDAAREWEFDYHGYDETREKGLPKFVHTYSRRLDDGRMIEIESTSLATQDSKTTVIIRETVE